MLLGDTRTTPGLPMSVRYNPARQEYIFTASLAKCVSLHAHGGRRAGLAIQWVSGVASPQMHCLVKQILGVPDDWRPTT